MSIVQKFLIQVLKRLMRLKMIYTTDTLAHQFTMEQSSAVNENIRLENYTLHGEGVLLEETDGDKVLFENDSTSVGENIALERGSDTGITAYLLQETYIVGDSNTTKQLHWSKTNCLIQKMITY